MTYLKLYTSLREHLLCLMDGAAILHAGDMEADTVVMNKLVSEGYAEHIPGTNSYKVTESGQIEAARVHNEFRARNGWSTSET